MAEILNPQDAELEEVILGACLIGREAMPMVADRLRPEMFYFDKNALIYAAMQVMYREGRQIDIITVKNELVARGKLDAAGGPYELTRISGRVASAVHLEYHVLILREKYLRREMILGFHKLLALAADETTDIGDTLVDAHNLLDRLEGECGTIEHLRDMDTLMDDTLQQVEVQEEPQPLEADELFDDFIFNYASDDALQRKRTVFPLPYYNRDTPVKIEERFWKHDYLFTKQNYYTLLFDNENDMDMVGDTTLKSVQVEWIYLKTRMVKKYYFERKEGMWMLEAINLRHIEEGEGENFVDFYTRFVTDSVYQSKHITTPLQFVTIDPDDEFSILETTLDVNQWYAFRPSLPTDRLSNINYGQKNEDTSRTKILKVNGIGNGYSNVFYFRRRGGEWEMYKYEDTSI